MRVKVLVLAFIAAVLMVYAGCDTSDGVNNDDILDSKTSLAYKGHEGDVDVENLCRVYHSIIGTRLDDCQTCHAFGDIGGRDYNACDYCHELIVHSVGHTYRETLNSYGADYMDAGRDKQAIVDIKGVDSDGDTFSNNEEINDLRFPGNPASKPGQPLAEIIVLDMADLKAMSSLKQMLLSNPHRQQFADYVVYKGVTFRELFDSLSIDLTGATGITVSAPDGFSKSFPINLIDLDYPDPLWYPGLDVATLGVDCGFVVYPPADLIPAGLTFGGPIPGEHRLMIAYERDGMAMTTSYMDPVELSIEGEGPFRLIVPQTVPGAPDRGLKYSPTACADGYDFDETKDHNAGQMVRGAIVVRIDPMPAGVEEFDYMHGWKYIDKKQFVVYGHGVE